MPRYYVDASVFIEGGGAFGMISGQVELAGLPIVGSVLPGLSINELVVEQLVERDQVETMAALKDISMPSVAAARDLFKRCESKGLFTDEWDTSM